MTLRAPDQGEKTTEEWIDHAIDDGCAPMDLAKRIATVTQPDGAITPERTGNEGWFWPWNRAGFRYLHGERRLDAAVIFQCAYLCALRFQTHGLYRIHKGAPLCNVAYALLTADRHEQAIVPAALGLVEDVMTFAEPSKGQNYQNLLAARATENLVWNSADYFSMFTRRRGILPLFPEVVLDWRSRFDALSSRELLATMRDLSEFTAESLDAALDLLAPIWVRFQSLYSTGLPRGIVNGGTSGIARPDVLTRAPAPISSLQSSSGAASADTGSR